jgi:hypothetical protein
MDMDEQDKAAPAGDGAQPVDTSLDGVLARRSERRDKEAAEQPKADESRSEDAEQPEPGEEPEPTADEADAPGAEEAPEPEAGDSEPEYAHGNLKVRFRDGSEATVGDLKKGREELQELRRQVPDVLAARQEVEQVKARLAQQQQQFEQVLPFALQAIQSVIPPEPDDALWDTDPIEAGRQQRLRDKAIRQRDGLTAHAQQQQAEALQSYIQEQQSKLLTARPDLREPEKAKAFYGEYIAAAQALGFTQAEADSTYDHRLVNGIVSLWQKAKQWDALQAAKTKVAAKTQSAAPVATPGRRAAPGEQGSTQVKVAEQQARKTGSIDDVLALRNARSSLKQR